MRAYWYELSLAAAAVLAVLAAKVVGHLIPALGGFKINKGVTGLIPLGKVPGNGPLVLRSVLALFGADFQDAPAGGGNHPVNLAFAAVHLAGLALVVAAVAAAVWGLARTLAWLARDRLRRPGTLRQAGDLVADVTVVAIVICVVTYFLLFRISNIYSAHEIGPVLALGAALAGRRFGGPLARACGLRTGTVPGAIPADGAATGRATRGTAQPAHRASRGRPGGWRAWRCCPR